MSEDLFTAAPDSIEHEPDLLIPPPPKLDRPRPNQPAPHLTTPTQQTAPRRVSPPTWALLLIMLGVCLVVTVAVAALLQAIPAIMPESLLPQATGGAESVDIEKLPTFTSPPTIPAEASVIQEGGTPLQTVLPSQLTIAGATYAVIPVTPDQGRWPLPAEQYDVAVWIHGTVINYVVGMPYTPTTESRLAELSNSDRITMTLDNGTTLVFGSPQPQRIAADDLAPMQQQRPGLTLVILGSAESTRLVVRARYLPEESFSAENRQRVDGLLLEQLKSGVTQEGDDTRYFVVEYRVTNDTGAEVNPAFFDMVLEDKNGQRYQVNDAVTASGEHGALQAPIPPDETVTGSAGYLVPRDMQPPITWIFRADPASANAARYVLPYEAPQPRPAQPDVELNSAFVDGRRNVIVINGVVYNDGETALNVTLGDVELTYGARSSSLQASTPLLPWTVAGGAQQAFELQFSRPADTDAVTLDVLGFTFQIDGLP